MKHIHLRQRNGTWYFRRAVPSALIKIIGKREITYSLRTNNLKEASRLARIESLKWDQKFAVARARMSATTPSSGLPPEELARLAELYIAQILADDDFIRRDGRLQHGDMHKHYGAAMSSFSKESASIVSMGSPSSGYRAMDEFLATHGITLTPDTPQYREAAYTFAKADQRLHEALEARHAGKPVETPDIAPLVQRYDMRGDTLEALGDYWLSLPAKGGGDKSRTSIAGAATIIRKFREMVGDIPPSKITEEHVIQLRDKMLEAGSKPATINKDRGILAAIFATAFKNKRIKHNPFASMEKLPVAGTGKRHHYTAKELQAIFDSPVFAKNERPALSKGEAAFWMPLIGLYTGARLNEVGQIRTDEVGNEDGIPFILFKHDPASGRSTKDKKDRWAPIHPDLISFGLLDYVDSLKEDKELQLFPLLGVKRTGGKAADKWGDWWRDYVRETVGIDSIPQPFHALRHTFTDNAIKSNISYEHRMRIEGHSMNTVGDKSYVKGLYPLEPLYESIKRLHFRGLNLSHLRKK